MQKLEIINNKIHVIRNQKVMLDFDLAYLYQIETKVLKQAVRRNIERTYKRRIRQFEVTNCDLKLWRNKIYAFCIY
jgi:hypothetical protein